MEVKLFNALQLLVTEKQKVHASVLRWQLFCRKGKGLIGAL